MTNEKTKDTPSANAPAPNSEVAEQTQSKSNFAKAAQSKAASKKSGTGKGAAPWWWLVFILLLIALIAFIWFSWPQFRNSISSHLDFLPGKQNESSQATSNIEEIPPKKVVSNTVPAEQPSQDQPESQPGPVSTQSPQATSQAPALQLDQLQRADTALSNQIQQQAQTIAKLQQQLAVMQRSITAQGNRLGELGNVSREDWQLAEADYLLRMANQRLILEDDSRAALGLVEKVDAILRQVNLPDLYGVRQQLAKDITALKLVENVDREGLYLRLRALEEQLIRARIQPEFDMTQTPVKEPQVEPAQENLPAWKRSWRQFTHFLRESVRPIDGDINPVMLSPQSEARFRQTLRLNMEQAQLALLRGDSTVYKDALDSAHDLLMTYGTASTQRNTLAKQLSELSQERIQAQMPDLNASQVALYNYIERLHKTSGQSTSAPGEDAQ
ncbi:uroporphyrinogen-III C-methyltransferase [Microbulbifer epialgicus]|uniref:Uroporphyrinogen-III C-methyltransferase n=1 Tax=Microbulbifer epialgicus TaxID=393907 RepID=A0ABV4NX77_9GAMM